MNQTMKVGIIYSSMAYLIWGLFPVYWKLLAHVSAEEILANRMLWSFTFMVIVLIVTRKLSTLKATFQVMKAKPKQAILLVVASLLVSVNWFLYIWAVNHDHVIETSLGYYINPLMSVLLGVVILKESLSKVQIISFIIALGGVVIMTVSYGQFPWVALGLAVSFSLYSLAKKMIQVEPAVGLTLEAAAVTPLAVVFLFYSFINDRLTLFTYSSATDFFLMIGGVVTAIPLLLFAQGAQKIPLYLIGFLQYITPTMTLLLGVFLYHEPFTKVEIMGFSCIWLALALFTLSQTKWFHKRDHMINKASLKH